MCVYAPGEAYVQTIGVTTRKQRHGLGTALLGALLAEAGQCGARQVDLEVRADNAIAIAMYEKHGFQTIGVRRGYYTDNREDALIMWKDPVQEPAAR